MARSLYDSSSFFVKAMDDIGPVTALGATVRLRLPIPVSKELTSNLLLQLRQHQHDDLSPLPIVVISLEAYHGSHTIEDL